MLEERAAVRHVQHLDATADAKEGNVPLNGPSHQRSLKPVTLMVGVFGLDVGIGSVQRGPEVIATREHQSVDQIEKRVGAARMGREHNRHPACVLHLSYVIGCHDGSLLLPWPPLRVNHSAGNTDNRSDTHYAQM